MKQENTKWEKIAEAYKQIFIVVGLQAYQTTDEFMNGEGALLNMTARGREVRPFIINALMDYFVKEYCDRGELPFYAEERKNSRHNSPFYLFRGENLMFTISRVAKDGGFPRKADFRSGFSLNNDQISLFPELETNILKEGAYAVLTHGGKEELEFVRWGLPRAGEDAWIENVSLFDRKAPHIAVAPAPAIEVKKPKLKKFVEERLEEGLK